MVYLAIRTKAVVVDNSQTDLDVTRGAGSTIGPPKPLQTSSGGGFHG